MKAIALIIALLCATLPADAQPFLTKVGAHITTATTTTLVAGTAGRSIEIFHMSICLDNAGTAGAITIQDSAALNLVGTGVVYVLGPNTCLTMPFKGRSYFLPTGAGNGLQIVSGSVGPFEVYAEVSK